VTLINMKVITKFVLQHDDMFSAFWFGVQLYWSPQAGFGHPWAGPSAVTSSLANGTTIPTQQ